MPIQTCALRIALLAGSGKGCENEKKAHGRIKTEPDGVEMHEENWEGGGARKETKFCK